MAAADGGAPRTAKNEVRGRPRALVGAPAEPVGSRPLARARELGEAYLALIGRHYPAMAVVEVKALIEDRAKVEIETTAVIPT
jgi:hypothetical protein